MPVYRLTPRSGTENCPQWRASSMRPHCLWIRARDEHEARLEVARATAVCPAFAETLAPWKDEELVACEYDDTKKVAEGIIYVRRAPLATSVNRQQRVSA